eukprot:Skav213302  [mRNA]  locus=scaffold2480:586091:587909:- [translate_table: standard]
MIVYSGYVYREWLPNAKQVFLIGEFNGWQNSTPLQNEGFGRWKIDLPDKAPAKIRRVRGGRSCCDAELWSMRLDEEQQWWQFKQLDYNY